MVNEVEELRQRELNFAIVDEVDSILIDEARTPYHKCPACGTQIVTIGLLKLLDKLVPEDYVLDEKRRTVALTDDGVEKKKMLGIKNLYSPDYIRPCITWDQALKAQTLFKRQRLRGDK